MSDIDSEKSLELVAETQETDNKNKPKYKGYFCDKCGYKTNKIKSFISHITRKIPCDTVKDYDYGVSKALERYRNKSEIILDMLDKLEDNQEIDIKKLNKLVDEVQKLGRINPNFRPDDIKEIRDIIKSKTNQLNNNK